MRLPVMPPVAPMLAKVGTDLPPGAFYEPKWDGFRSIVFRDGDEVEIGSRNTRPMARYFPEVVAAARESLPPRCVVDGEIIVAGADGRLDFWALQQRLHPAASRVDLLAGQTPASFVAFDLLALGDEDLTGAAVRRAPRRARGGARRRAAAGPPHARHPATPSSRASGSSASRAPGSTASSPRRPELTYQPDKRVMTKIKHVRTADCVLAGYRVHKSGPDASARCCSASTTTGALRSVGVVGAFPMARRRELFAELQPLVCDFEDHPWNWAREHIPAQAAFGSRWNPGKSLSFVPLRPERVLEVRYDHMEGSRFRHPPQFVRWRPDRDPESCGYAQLERPVDLDVAQILG